MRRTAGRSRRAGCAGRRRRGPAAPGRATRLRRRRWRRRRSCRHGGERGRAVAGARPGRTWRAPTPGAEIRSGLTRPPNESPRDENGATRPASAFAAVAARPSATATSVVDAARPRAAGRAVLSGTRPPGPMPAREAERAGGRACRRRAPPRAPARGRGARPARRRDRVPRPATSTALPRRAIPTRRGRSRARAGDRARPGTRGSEQRQLRRPEHDRAPGRTTTRTDAVVGRSSVAPTVSAGGGAARAGERAEERAGRAVVPGRRDDERVERERAGDRLAPRGCRRTRRTARRRRAARSAAASWASPSPFGIDGAVEPGDQLVAARVDGARGPRRRLPAGDADREHDRARRDAVEPVRAARADEQPGQLPSRGARAAGGSAGSACASAVAAPPTRSKPGLDAAGEVRLLEVDAGVEERDREAGAVEPGQRRRRGATPARARCAEIAAGKAARTGYTPATSGFALEQRDRARVEGGREAVEHACVADSRAGR